jgi:hypothetical protein
VEEGGVDAVVVGEQGRGFHASPQRGARRPTGNAEG